MCAPKMPAPPDPVATGRAQTQTNIDTAIANNRMVMVDQVTPYGSLTYETIYDTPPPTAPMPPQVAQPTGRVNPMLRPNAEAEVVRRRNSPQASLTGGFTPSLSFGPSVPRYRATTTLAPDQQAILDANNRTRLSFGELAAERSDFLKDYLPNATPEAIDEKIYSIGAQRLDPRFAREEEALRTRLANQGLTQGSAAWEAEMERFAQGKNDAYNNLVINARNTALSEINNPINQITALLGQSQVQNPAVSMTQPAQMPTVDQAGLINANYDARVRNAAMQQQGRQSLLGGLFGLGSGAMIGGYI